MRIPAFPSLSAPRSPRRAQGRLLLALAAAALLVPLASSADPETEARYPFDPACPWGRVANGRGMLLRCLSEAEAQRLAQAGPSTPRGALPDKTNADTPSREPVLEDKAPPAEEPKKKGDVQVSLGPIVADEGAITLGKLSKPLDRYKQCIDDNGGLTAAKGTVVVQFLVRAEFGRAEGVEVKSATGVSKKAARCLADVVDRRQPGPPSSAMTGVSLTFEITHAK